MRSTLSYSRSQSLTRLRCESPTRSLAHGARHSLILRVTHSRCESLTSKDTVTRCGRDNNTPLCDCLLQSDSCHACSAELAAQAFVASASAASSASLASSAFSPASSASLASDRASGRGREGQGKAGVWRYLFSYTGKSSEVPGATHGQDGGWWYQSTAAETAESKAMQRAMGQWWVSMATAGDPNANASVPAAPAPTSAPGAAGALVPGGGGAGGGGGGGITVPQWEQFTYTAAGRAMVMDTPAPSLQGVERPECEHWKPYLGW